MASTIFNFFSFPLQPGNSIPIALVVPMSQRAVLGSIIKLDGRSSYDPDGDSLTYTWTFLEVPTGSELTDSSFEELEDDYKVVAFAPDVAGMYRVQLIVNDGQFDSEPYIAVAYAQAALVPTCTDVIPDVKFMFRTVSDFWSRQFEQRDMLPIPWSSYVQAVGAELLRLYETDHNKSIKDIQEMSQRRWLAYEPRLELDPSLHYGVRGNEQEGLHAQIRCLLHTWSRWGRL